MVRLEILSENLLLMMDTREVFSHLRRLTPCILFHITHEQLSWSNDNKEILTVGADQVAKIWNIEDSKVVAYDFFYFLFLMVFKEPSVSLLMRTILDTNRFLQFGLKII